MMNGRRSCHSPRLALLCALLGGVLNAGCASKQVRVDQFSQFSTTGSAFVKAMDPVLTESFDATAATSSTVLLETRDALAAKDRLPALTQADDDLKSRLAILRDLKRHLGVLQSYFDALAALSTTTAESSGTLDVAQALVTSLGKLNPRIASAKIGDTSVASLVGPVAKFTFVAHQSRVLNDELKKHAAAIDGELQLQEAALGALADAYTADLEVVAEKAYRDQVALPFAMSAPLAADWASTRAALLQATLKKTSLQAAADAMRRLRANFVALVENRLDAAGIVALQSDINDILDVVEKSRKARTGTQTHQGGAP